MKVIDGLSLPSDADDGEFSLPRLMNPDPGDPLGPPSKRWPTVVKGRLTNVELGYD